MSQGQERKQNEKVDMQQKNTLGVPRGPLALATGAPELWPLVLPLAPPSSLAKAQDPWAPSWPLPGQGSWTSSLGSLLDP